MNTSDITNDLVLNMPLDEIAEGKVIDESGNDIEGTVTGASIVPDEVFGSCMSFDGTGDFINTGLHQKSVTAYTLSVWVKINDNGAGTIIQARGNGPGKSITLSIGHGGTTGKVLFCLDSDYILIGVRTSTRLNDGEWHHVVGVFSAASGKQIAPSDFKIHVDGRIVETTEEKIGEATAPLTGEGTTQIGYHKAWNQYFNGKLAHVRIYKRALSAVEIKKQMYRDTNPQKAFKAEYPIEFSLIDSDELNVFFISHGGASNNNFQAELKNCSDQNIVIPKKSGQPDAANHHFALKFKPKTFEATKLAKESGKVDPDDPETYWQYLKAGTLPEDWSASDAVLDMKDGKITLYLLYSGKTGFTLKDEATLSFDFEYKSADSGLGSRGTNVELLYKDLQYENDTTLIQGTRLKSAEIVNRKRHTEDLGVVFGEKAQEAKDAEGRARAAEVEAKREAKEAQKAKGLAEDAKTKAETALTNAEEEKKQAQDAKAAAETAQTAAETAQTTAEKEKQQAQDAKAAAVTAQTAAETALTNAEKEKQQAQDAQTAAEDAKTKALDAETKAKEARLAAEEALSKGTQDAAQKVQEAQKAKTDADTAKKAAEVAQTTAEKEKQEAQDAKAAAVTAQTAAETALTNAEKEKKQAQDAKAAAVTAQTAAETALTNAEKEKKQAQDAKAAAVTAQTAAVTAQTNAQKEKQQAQDAKAAAVTAKTNAETAQAAAENAAKMASKGQPLQIGIVGSNTILNNGKDASTIKIRLTNSLKDKAISFKRGNLDTARNTKFTLLFDDPVGEDWDLATQNQLNAIGVTVQEGSSKYTATKQNQGSSVSFYFTPNRVKLNAGDHIDITLSNIITESASGLATIYIEYEDIQDLYDGKLAVQVEKTPIVHRRVDGNELVGIGTASSQNKLDVEGSVAIGASYSGTNTAPSNGLLVEGNVGIGTASPKIHLAIGDSDTGLHQQGDGQLSIYTNNSERVRINNSGNIGVGTTNPTEKLHVNGKVKITNGLEVGGNRTYFKDSEKSDGSGLRVGAAWGMYGIYSENGACVVGGQNGVKIQYDKVTVTQDGKVGIGTASPTAKLDVTVRDHHLARFMYSSGGTGVDIDGWENGVNLDPIAANKNFYFGRDVALNSFIVQSGKVGIGTTSPKNKLDVAGGLTVSGTTKTAKLQLGDKWLLSGDGDAHGNDTWLRLLGAGGAGYDRKSYGDLAVGNFYAAKNATVSGNLTASGTLHVGNVPYGDRKNAQWDSSSGQFYHDNSSRRFKENITPLEDEFDQILKAKPKTYTRPGEPDRWELGYIAEEFDELGLKKLVDYDEEGLPESINYTKIILYVVEVLKKLKAENDTIIPQLKEKLRNQLGENP